MAPTQAAFCAALIDELRRGGVQEAVICPGSRSTPLALAAAASDLAVTVRLDERAAAFFALGAARRSGAPVLVVVTSGTAAAELHAAVAEATLDGVPLIVATADRPPRLHGVGAPQTIPQHDLFGSNARFHLDVGLVTAWPRTSWRSLAARLVLEATNPGGEPGAVHVNLAFEEPLLAEPDEVPPGRDGDLPWNDALAVHARPARRPLVLDEPRGVVVAGQGAGPSDALLAAADRLGWPVLADPRSGARRPGAIGSADALLRDESLAASLRPDAIVAIGGPHASRVLNEWLDEAVRTGASLLRVGPDSLAHHPGRGAGTIVPTEPLGLWELVGDGPDRSASPWLTRWRALDDAAQAAFDALLERVGFCEPAVARHLSRRLDGDAALLVSSSMPIRDLEWFGALRDSPVTVLANRGANGIDGVVSTAMGAALPGAPTVALVGDLAFLHDVSSLVDGVRPGAALVVVVVDNRGGGIFSFLPQRGALSPERFELLFGTPRNHDLVAVAAGFGHEATRISSLGELDDALDHGLGREGLSVVVASMPDRSTNVQIHEELVAAATTAARASDPQR